MSTKLGSAYGEVILETSGVNKGVSDAQRAIKGLEGGFLSLNPAIAATQVALGGIAVVGGSLAGVIGSSVSIAADLEQQLDNVQAASGASKDEMAQLKDLIGSLGLDPNLKVSASEAANAIENLMRNGLTVQEVLDGAARSTVLLANATGAEFTEAADIATDAMALFNIEAEDMEKAVDGITGVVNASKFSIQDYQLALAQGGGVASQYGLTLEEFNTVIAGISPAFASGSDAGTSFKTFLQRLIPQSEDAADAMAALGLEFFDANGNLKDMNDISKMLNSRLNEEFEMTVELGGATKEMQKAAEKATEKIPKLTTTLAEQDQQMAILQKELQATIEKYGEGSTQADKKRLAITKLTNDIEENKKALGEQQGALDEMTNATVETITTTTKLTEEQRANTLTTIFGSDAIRSASGIAGLGAVQYQTAAEAVEALGVSMEAAQAVAEDGITAYEALQLQMSKVTAAENAATRMDNLKGSIEILQGVIESIQLRIGDEFIPGLKKGVDQATKFLTENADAIVDFFAGIAEGTGIVLDKITGFLPILLTLGQYLFLTARDGLTFNTFLFELPESLQPFAQMIGNLIATASTELPGLITKITDFLTEMVTAFNEGGLSGLADKFWEWITGGDGVQATAGGMVGMAIAAITQAINDNWPTISAALTEWSNKFWDWLIEVINKSGEKLAAIVTSIQTWANQPDTQANLQGLGYSLGMAFYDGIILLLGNAEKAGEAIAALLGALGAASLVMLPAISTIGESMAGGFLGGLISKITGGETSTQLQTMLGEIWSRVVQAVISTIVPGTAIAFAGENLAKMKEEFDKLDFGAIGTDLVDRLAKGITGAIGWVRDAVSKLVEEFNPLKYIEIPEQLTANSPTPFEMGMRGIASAVSKMPNLGAPFADLPGNDSLGGVSDMQSTMANLTVPTLPDIPLAAALPGAAEMGGGYPSSIGDISITIEGAGNPLDVAKAVRVELQNVFSRARRPAFAGG